MLNPLALKGLIKLFILKFTTMITWLLIWMIPHFSCLSCSAKILKLSMASDLFGKKSTQMYLDKSSTKTKMYHFPAILSGVMGPIRSMFTSSSMCFYLISAYLFVFDFDLFALIACSTYCVCLFFQARYSSNHFSIHKSGQPMGIHVTKFLVSEIEF